MCVRGAAGWALVAAGCGPLADADWRGEKLFTLSGSVLSGESYEAAGELRVAMFWAWDGKNTTEQSVVVETEFPAKYTLEVYAFPPNEVLFVAPWSVVPTAIGLPLLYDDADLDGRYGPDEQLVGGPNDLGVLYVPPLPDDVFVVDRTWLPDGSVAPVLRSGFQRVANDLRSTLCGEAGSSYQGPLADGPTDLMVGAFWVSFADWNCDSDPNEWADVCPEVASPEFAAWCETLPDPGSPCAEACRASGY